MFTAADDVAHRLAARGGAPARGHQLGPRALQAGRSLAPAVLLAPRVRRRRRREREVLGDDVGEVHAGGVAAGEMHRGLEALRRENKSRTKGLKFSNGPFSDSETRRQSILAGGELVWPHAFIALF